MKNILNDFHKYQAKFKAFNTVMNGFLEFLFNIDH